MKSPSQPRVLLQSFTRSDLILVPQVVLSAAKIRANVYASVWIVCLEDYRKLYRSLLPHPIPHQCSTLDLLWGLRIPFSPPAICEDT